MANEFWKDKRVLVTGGTGFLGRSVVSALSARGAASVFSPSSAEFDLIHEEAVARLFRLHPADVVIHLAARAGGIGHNDDNAGRFLYENLTMGAQVMEYARLSGAAKFVQIGSATAYPPSAPVPYKEDSLWSGPIEATHLPHAAAKLALQAQAQAYRRQYGFRAVTLILVNLYGPGDRFDLSRARVIPSLMRKCLEAKKALSEEVVLWGTGRPTRDFLYVDEAAEGLLLAAELYDDARPVNLGSGREVSIAELARRVAKLTGYQGVFRFDASRPDGQPRQWVDAARAREAFGFKPRLSLDEGLKKTLDWYSSQSNG